MYILSGECTGEHSLVKHNRLSETYDTLASAAAADKSFATFDLNLPPTVMKDVQTLKVAQHSSYDNFGDIQNLRDETARFLEEIGNAPALSQRVADAIDRLVKDSLSTVKAETAWFTLRAFTGTHEFDKPRWHIDGYFYTPTETAQRKIATTLKGPGTLLNDLPDNLRSTFNKLLRTSGNTMAGRQALAQLVDPTQTQSIVPGQGVIFTVGSEERAAVHSEPPIPGERLFMSLLPGTREQIAELRKNWNAPQTTYTSAPKPPLS